MNNPAENITPDELDKVLAALKGFVNFRYTNTEYPAAGQGFEWDGVPHVILPSNCTLANMEKSQAAPRRIRSQPVLHDLPSFLAYVNRYKDNETTIFAAKHAEGLGVTAIFDYPAPDKPRWGDHRVSLRTQHSDEWNRWVASDGEPKTQTQFAEFVENEQKLFVKPTGADMLTYATEIDIRRTVNWQGSTRLATGDIAVSFVSETKANGGKGEVELPTVFSVALQPFLNGERYEVQARLRVGIDDGKLELHYELQRVEEVLQHAMDEVMSAIVSSTSITPLIGATPGQV